LVKRVKEDRFRKRDWGQSREKKGEKRGKVVEALLPKLPILSHQRG
jgi:hypothetical protein